MNNDVIEKDSLPENGIIEEDTFKDDVKDLGENSTEVNVEEKAKSEKKDEGSIFWFWLIVIVVGIFLFQHFFMNNSDSSQNEAINNDKSVEQRKVKDNKVSEYSEDFSKDDVLEKFNIKDVAFEDINTSKVKESYILKATMSDGDLDELAYIIKFDKYKDAKKFYDEERNHDSKLMSDGSFGDKYINPILLRDNIVTMTTVEGSGKNVDSIVELTEGIAKYINNEDEVDRSFNSEKLSTESD